MTVRLICDAGATIGETPVKLDDTIYWTDPVARRLLRLEANGAHASTAVEQSVWSLGVLPDRTLAGTIDNGFCAVDPTGAVTAGPAARVDAGCRLNDMVVDPRGGLWGGAMHRGVLATRGAIFHAPSLDETPHCVASGIGVPNGMALARDGSALFVIDTLMRTLLAFPIDGRSLGEPVIVTDFLGLPGKPDGMALALDGSFWVAMWGGGTVVQIARDGATLRTVSIPAPHVSSVCVADADCLLVSTSKMRLGPQALLDYPGSGGLFEIRLGAAS